MCDVRGLGGPVPAVHSLSSVMSIVKGGRFRSLPSMREKRTYPHNPHSWRISDKYCTCFMTEGVGTIIACR